MRVHEKKPRQPAHIAIGVSLGAIGIGLGTMVSISATVIVLPGAAAAPVAALGFTGLTAVATIAVIGFRALATSRQYYNNAPQPEETPMSGITGNEPAHWHDEHGHHRMKDPREVYGNHWKNQTGNWTDADERAYTRHLIAHESILTTPELQPGDSDAVHAVIAMMQSAEKTLRVGTELITALRQQQQQKEADE